MTKNNVVNFLKISELYLRITELKRSAVNMEEIVPLMFSDEENCSETFNLVTASLPLQININ